MDQFAAAALANDPSQQMQYPVPGNVVVMNHPHNFNLQYQMQIIQNFWQNQFQIAESGNYDFKNFQLPLARIKKVMKSDGDVKMIGSDAPIIFAKACEVFVLELTLRSWIHTEENKRRTLQKSDISIAISKSDMFDFLIDIVPRDEYKAVGGNNMIGGLPASAANLGIPASLAPPKIQEQFGNGGNVFYYNPGQDMQQQQQQQQQQLQQQEQDDLYQQQSQQGNTSLTQYQQQRGGYF